MRPFHSYNGGPSQPKRFPHVCVLPRRGFNSNLAAEAEFIFHAAGRSFDEAGNRISKEQVRLQAALP